MKTNSSNSPLGYIVFTGIVLGISMGLLLDRPSGGKNQDLEGVGTPGPSLTPTAEFWMLPTLESTRLPSTQKSWSVVKVGKPAPDFALNDRYGKLIRLSDFQGKVVIINFWASWCPACKSEMPDLQSIFDEYGDQELVVLGVNTLYVDIESDAMELIDDLGLTFPIVFDKTGELGESLYTVYGLPTSFWIDRTGIIRWIKIGAVPKEQMIENVEILMLQ